jgi:hypothetical protein
MHRSLLLLPILLSGCGPIDRATGVATGFVSHQLCSAAFVSRIEPETFYRESIAPSLGRPSSWSATASTASAPR